MTDRGHAAPGPARLADRAARRPGRAGARRPGGGPRRARQGEPALPRPDVRPAARRAASRPTTRPARSRATFDGRRSTPGPARRSTSWSRSPTPRSSGSRPRGRPPTRCVKAQNTQREPARSSASSRPSARPTSSTATTSSSATRWPTRPRWSSSSPSRPADVKRVANQYLTANRVRLDVNPGPPTPRPPEVDGRSRRRRPRWRARRSPRSRTTFDRSVMPKVGPTPKFTPPPVVRRKLSNGLEVLIAERHELPILTPRTWSSRGARRSSPTARRGSPR